MILQLFIFAFLFIGFGIFSVFRRKRFIGFTFILLGAMVLAIASLTVYLYPDKSPF